MGKICGQERVLITGGNGFAGSYFIDELKMRGYNVHVLDTKEVMFCNANKNIVGSVEDKNTVRKAVSGCDFVLHLAGVSGTHELVGNAVSAVRTNIIGTLNVLDACREHGAGFIEVSKPNLWVDTYSITKTAEESFVEMYRRQYDIEAVTLKWFNVYGKGQPLAEEAGYQKLIPTVIVKALFGELIEVYGSGEQTIDPININDVVEATLSIIENWDACEGGVFEIGSGREITVNDAVQLIKSMTKSSSPINYVPMRRGEEPNTKVRALIGPIMKKTGWFPKTRFEEGLRGVIPWYDLRYVSGRYHHRD